MVQQLQIPDSPVDQIKLKLVHRFRQRGQGYERPIVAKCESLKDEIMVKTLGKRLAGFKIGMNNQFPKEITERRRVLYPLSKDNRLKGKRVALVVDKLYIDNQLFRDTKTTPWLF